MTTSPWRVWPASDEVDAGGLDAHVPGGGPGVEVDGDRRRERDRGHGEGDGAGEGAVHARGLDGQVGGRTGDRGEAAAELEARAGDDDVRRRAAALDDDVAAEPLAGHGEDDAGALEAEVPRGGRGGREGDGHLRAAEGDDPVDHRGGAVEAEVEGAGQGHAGHGHRHGAGDPRGDSCRGDHEDAAAVGDRDDRLPARGDREGEVGQRRHDDRLTAVVGRALHGEVGAQRLAGDREGRAHDLDPQVRAGREAERRGVRGVDRHRDGAAGEPGDGQGDRGGEAAGEAAGHRARGSR